MRSTRTREPIAEIVADTTRTPLTENAAVRAVAPEADHDEKPVIFG